MPITFQNISGLGKGWRAVCARCATDYTTKSVKQRHCSDECRFLDYQNQGAPNACWNWLGNKNNQGYGVFTIGRKVVGAHRLALRRTGVEIPPDKCVMHSCDNRMCVNPAHLSVGTWGDNNSDRSRKGRSGSRVYTEDQKKEYSRMFRGANNALAKLDDEKARAIKYMHKGLTDAQAGALYGVSKSVANHIRSGRSWRHV